MQSSYCPSHLNTQLTLSAGCTGSNIIMNKKVSKRSNLSSYDYSSQIVREVVNKSVKLYADRFISRKVPVYSGGIIQQQTNQVILNHYLRPASPVQPVNFNSQPAKVPVDQMAAKFIKVAKATPKPRLKKKRTMVQSKISIRSNLRNNSKRRGSIRRKNVTALVDLEEEHYQSQMDSELRKGKEREDLEKEEREAGQKIAKLSALMTQEDKQRLRGKVANYTYDYDGNLICSEPVDIKKLNLISVELNSSVTENGGTQLDFLLKRCLKDLYKPLAYLIKDNNRPITEFQAFNPDTIQPSEEATVVIGETRKVGQRRRRPNHLFLGKPQGSWQIEGDLCIQMKDYLQFLKSGRVHFNPSTIQSEVRQEPKQHKSNQQPDWAPLTLSQKSENNFGVVRLQKSFNFADLAAVQTEPRLKQHQVGSEKKGSVERCDQLSTTDRFNLQYQKMGEVKKQSGIPVKKPSPFALMPRRPC